MAGQSINRRRRALKHANDRAQRRFHAMFEAHVWSDPEAIATKLYVEAERLVDGIMAPEVHPTPVAVVESWATRWPYVEVGEGRQGLAPADGIPPALDTYWNRGA